MPKFIPIRVLQGFHFRQQVFYKLHGLSISSLYFPFFGMMCLIDFYMYWSHDIKHKQWHPARSPSILHQSFTCHLMSFGAIIDAITQLGNRTFEVERFCDNLPTSIQSYDGSALPSWRWEPKSFPRVVDFIGLSAEHDA
ncbi:hypothetical protein NC652_013882 [Populus alba x Populus x berolinensis]|nr:hypothetical protein NC652_013882 [Populus alba x Populus x berolinensis]